ncbi:MAG TPA: PEP/pyruvate-binding domain-containing protein [Anaerolineae bacterium]|nr:PEP/pyruvate-binding domain-containing protein [Anaerolineae bacterium]
MNLNLQNIPKALQLYLEISQYPILAKRIRERMRREIFARGVVSPHVFDQEVRDKAIRSQQLEGLLNPFEQESTEVWQARTEQIRDHLTDFYFAYNLPHDLFKEIVQDILSQRVPAQAVILSFNPELAPWDLLFAQGEAYENYPPDKRAHIQHHLREIIVVLIKGMISDQLDFVRVAREYFSVKDLKAIHSRRIGRGKIGGKAAGMLLAHKIVQRHGAEHGIDVENIFAIPESYFIGSDVFYDFHAANNLFRFMNQKYKSHARMEADYPLAFEAYGGSQLPDEVEWELARLLDESGRTPLIVRSSSLLEDSFGRSFAGKYDSFFLPNQGAPEENLRALSNAIKEVYASVIRPEALIYREQVGLTDYDERMAILIQRVEGRRYGRYFFPAFAGVGFSQNPYRWSARIRAEDGLLRLVTGLGTRAVERVGSDYPRMVALSHPTLRPEHTVSALRRYSQRQMDVIDLEGNACVTRPIVETLDINYPALSAIISLDQGDYVQSLASQPLSLDPRQLIVTFDRLLSHPPFIELMRKMLRILEQAYGHAVDTEFAGEVTATYPRLQVKVALLQCRALSLRQDGQRYDLPANIPVEAVLFSANRQVPHGYAADIRAIVYVDPRAYARIPNPHTRLEIGRVVGRLNQALADRRFILMGPGRWGTSNVQLGVKVTYADIYNTRVLIELAHEDGGSAPEVSYGTHFFQDLVEANIYPLPLYPDDPSTVYREDFFAVAPNLLPELLPADKDYAAYIKVIDVPAASGGCTLTIVMNAEEDKAMGYLTTGNQ